MKHLKPFYEKIDNDYYEIIDVDTYNNIMSNRIKFTQPQKDIIRKLETDDIKIGFFNSGASIKIEVDNAKYCLHALKDEWFVLIAIYRSTYEYKCDHYRCDQWEGLMKCIRNLLLL
jgi:hypothetical protein